jgi:protein SCO1/2
MLDQARFDQRLNQRVDPQLAFTDEAGQPVTLGDYLGTRPVVLVPVYFNCPNLCEVVLHDLIQRIKTMSFDVGRQFDLVIVSIDPRETPALAAGKKDAFVAEYGRAATAAGWHLLTGEQPQIQRLADTIGFHYAYDATMDQYAHPSGLVVLTPGGKISKYFYGLEYSATDLRLGLVEASANRIGSVIDQVILRCFHYDPVSGKYTVAIMNILRVAATATALVVGAAVLRVLRRERRSGSARTHEGAEGTYVAADS